MKRFLLTVPLVGVVLAVSFALRPGPLAGQAPRAGGSACCEKKDCPCPSTCCPAKKTKADAEVVAELVTILNETKNADTFLAALLALGRFEDKSPLPAVVRNAERLGLLKGLTKNEGANHVQQMIGAYLSGEMGAECEYARRTPYGPAMPGYAYPPPAPAWNAPPPMPMYQQTPTMVPPTPLSSACPTSAEKLGAPSPTTGTAPTPAVKDAAATEPTNRAPH